MVSRQYLDFAAAEPVSGEAAEQPEVRKSCAAAAAAPGTQQHLQERVEDAKAEGTTRTYPSSEVKRSSSSNPATDSQVETRALHEETTDDEEKEGEEEIRVFMVRRSN